MVFIYKCIVYCLCNNEDEVFFFINLVGIKVRCFNFLKVKLFYCLYVEDFFICLFFINVDLLMQYIKMVCQL